MHTDTDLYPLATRSPHFTFTGARLVHRGEHDHGTSCPMFRNVYTPSDEATRWDGANWATHALGSHLGVYSYCTVKVTGRKVTEVALPGCQGEYGWRCQVTVAQGTPDEQTFTAWLINAEWSNDIWTNPPTA